MAVEPSQVSMLSVIEAVGGSLSMAPCGGVPSHCGKHDRCAFHGLWKGADSLIRDYFSRITLAEVLEEGSDNQVILEALGKQG